MRKIKDTKLLREKNRITKQKYWRKIKTEVLTFYGDGELACVKCGENRLPCLSIDHINGKGSQHRKLVGGGHHLYHWLKKNEYPEGYQTLCMNCQYLKREEEKESPKDKLSDEEFRQRRKQSFRSHYERNSEKLRLYGREYYQKNKKARLEQFS